MATEIKKIVDPDAGAGYDYSSLASWEDDFGGHTSANGDLVSDDEYVVADCRLSAGTNSDTTEVDIDGWIVDATRNIRIEVTDIHAGKWDSIKYHLVAQNHWVGTIRVNEQYTEITGIQIDLNNMANYGIYITAADAAIDKCIMQGSTHTSSRGIYISGSGKASNCLMYDVNGSGIVIHTFAQCFIYNNIVVDSSNGFSRDAGASTHKLKNNIAQDNSGTNYTDGANFDSGSTHNITDDTPDGTICFGATYESGKTADGTEANKLVDSSETFPDVVVGNIVENTTDSTYTYITSIAEAGSGKLGLNDDIFVSGEGYNIYTNLYGNVSFVNQASDDYHLDSGDIIALNGGVDLSGDSDYSFTDDIDGETRSGTWDIGADEYVVAGGISIPVVQSHRRQQGVA